MSPEMRGLDTEAGEPKYARTELERRWLVDRAARPSLEGAWMTLIEDRYIVGTRMRLRRMSRPDLGETKWKLTKKYDTARPEARPIVTSYLTAAEYEVLTALPARVLVKRRYHLPIDRRFWSLDVFEGPLTGLVLAEIEFPTEEAADRSPIPATAIVEVSHDPRFSGGRLVRTEAGELRSWLDELGVPVIVPPA